MRVHFTTMFFYVNHEIEIFHFHLLRCQPKANCLIKMSYWVVSIHSIIGYEIHHNDLMAFLQWNKMSMGSISWAESWEGRFKETGDRYWKIWKIQETVSNLRTYISSHQCHPVSEESRSCNSRVIPLIGNLKVLFPVPLRTGLKRVTEYNKFTSQILSEVQSFNFHRISSFVNYASQIGLL